MRSKGSKIVSRFQKTARVLNVDFAEPRENQGAFHWLSGLHDEGLKSLKRFIEEDFLKNQRLNAVICVAGGFEKKLAVYARIKPAHNAGAAALGLRILARSTGRLSPGARPRIFG